MAKELGIPIGYNGRRQTMEFHHISKEEFCYVTCIIYLLTWYEMSHLPQPIHNHKNKVKSPLGLG